MVPLRAGVIHPSQRPRNLLRRMTKRNLHDRILHLHPPPLHLNARRFDYNPPLIERPGMAAKIEKVCDTTCTLGEGPIWHPDEQCLYWTDILQNKVYRYDPGRRKHQTIYDQDRPVGGITIQADGDLLLFRDGGNVVAWRDGKLRRTIVKHVPQEKGFRYNDVFADPMGRVYCGSVPFGNDARFGRLYRLDPDGRVTQLLDGIGCSNGMGFTPDLRHLYYTDSTVFTIYQFDYDRATGNLSHQRAWAKLQNKKTRGHGYPDGLTVDLAGQIWGARWDGACIARHAPDSRLLQRIYLPALRPTSLAFGGPDYRDLYVTSAGGNDRKSFGPGAGALFRIRTNARGLPDFYSRAGLP